MTDVFEPCLMTTGIGSAPVADPDQGAAFVLEADLSIPFWPQLPKRGFVEQIVPQYASAMPCVTIDTAAERVIYDRSDKHAELERFYEAYLSEDLEAFALSDQSAAGIGALERAAAGRTWPLIKGHVVGPVSFATEIVDAEKNPLYGDAELRDAAVKLLARNAQWQIQRLAPLAEGKVLIFVDEPALAAYGSSTYVYVSEADVRTMLDEIFTAIRQAGGIAGIHVCGNSDWGMVVRTGVDVINFDAYQYGPTLALYADDIATLFDRGGSIAWGIVPTLSAAVATETVESLVARLDECFVALEAKGLDGALIRRRALLTPSCGTGTLTADEGRKVFGLLRGLREIVTSR